MSFVPMIPHSAGNREEPSTMKLHPTALKALAAMTAALLASVAQALPPADSGRDVATCYGVYDALLEMADIEKLTKEERDALTFKRDNAQAIALMLLDREGIDENTATDLIYTASYNAKQTLSDTREATGHDGVEEMHRLGKLCDQLLKD
jgi:hypothetical protein